MIKRTLWTLLLCTIAVLLESTILARIAVIKDIIPDISLCILIYSAYVNGTMIGQVSGFFSGLLRDFLSSAPLGLNCLVRTLIGALTGIFKGSLFLDYFIMPVVLCSLATILKYVIYLILHLIIGNAIPMPSFLSSTLWIEVGLNGLSAPLLFLLLRLIKYISPVRR